MLRRITMPLANIAKLLFKDKTEAAIFLSAFLVEIAFGLYLVYRWGHTFVVGDAISHLYIPRTVIGNGAQSNFANLGTVWLPMFHILVMPLVLIDSLYTTGFAGTIVSALMTGGICLIFYRLIGNKKLGILASLLYLSNAFTLNYGATAMDEQTALFFIILGVYYFTCYQKTDNVAEFMKSSLAFIFGTLTRYEVWVIAIPIALIFSLRELKKGQGYRVAYAHLPLWGIFAWLFWNFATFRDPLMFIYHFSSAPAQWSRIPLPFVGSISLTTSYILEGLFTVSGLLYLVAILSIIVVLANKGRARILPALFLIFPLIFHWYLAFMGMAGGHVRYLYMSFPGLIASPFLLINKIRKSLGALLLLSIFVTYFVAYPTQVYIITGGTYPHVSDFSKVNVFKEELMTLEDKIGDGRVLWSAGFSIPSSFFSVLMDISPSQIVDDYDNPFYLGVMEEPWKYCSFVVIGKTSPHDSTLNATNAYYKGKYYAYRYYNDDLWRLAFLGHYKLSLETEHFLLFQKRVIEL